MGVEGTKISAENAIVGERTPYIFEKKVLSRAIECTKINIPVMDHKLREYIDLYGGRNSNFQFAIDDIMRLIFDGGISDADNIDKIVTSVWTDTIHVSEHHTLYQKYKLGSLKKKLVKWIQCMKPFIIAKYDVHQRRPSPGSELYEVIDIPRRYDIVFNEFTSIALHGNETMDESDVLGYIRLMESYRKRIDKILIINYKSGTMYDIDITNTIWHSIHSVKGIIFI